MNILTTPTAIQTALRGCMSTYRHYDWAVAWAGAGSDFDLFAFLARSPKKIRKLIIGTHFCQTHPDFIERFQDYEGVRFIRSTDELFHPKVYWFENSPNDWACIVGSANFTMSAMKRNVEVCIMITSQDHGAKVVPEEIQELIERHWDNAVPGNEIDLVDYRKKWEKHARFAKVNSQKIHRKRGQTIEKEIVIDGHASVGALLNVNWKNYQKAIVNADRYKRHGDATLKALGVIAKLWRVHSSYAKMSKVDQNKLLGTSGDFVWLGNMGANRKFMANRTQIELDVSRALNEIPLDKGKAVTETHYQSFIKKWELIPNVAIGIASRLLTVRRPDVFCSVNKRSNARLSGALGIKTIDTSNYFHSCLNVFHQSSWWNAPCPKSAEGSRLWSSRMAILDFLVCDDE